MVSTEGVAVGATVLVVEAEAEADAFAFASAEVISVEYQRQHTGRLTLEGFCVDGELDSLGRRLGTQVITTSLQSPFPAVEMHRGELSERGVGKVDVE